MASAPYVIENVVSLVDLQGVVRHVQRTCDNSSTLFSFRIIQPLLKSIHYDFIYNLGLSIPLGISQGGISIRNSQVTIVSLEGLAIKLQAII